MTSILNQFQNGRPQRRHRLVAARWAGVVALLTQLLACPLQATDLAATGDAGDGRVSPFYTWTAALPAVPGQILRTEPLPDQQGLTDASQQIRILYTSTDGVSGQGIVPVSGALFLPKGPAPKGGWPLVAWAHGTVGTADICAPSWAGRSYRDIKYLNAWLAQGYAVVASDYQGLGTPGPHPYMETRPAAYSVLDSIRAAQHLRPDIAEKAVIVGQSQGAGAAFSAAAYWPDYAPDLRIAATVATGIPYHGGPRQPPAMNVVQPNIVVTFYLVQMMKRAHPEIDPAALFQPKALDMYERARSVCLINLEDDALLERLTPMNSVTPALSRVISDRNFVSRLIYPTYQLKMPLFVGSGDADEYTAPESQAALVKKICEAGTAVKAVRYPGLSHSETVNASLRDSLPFVRDALVGRHIQSTCGADRSVD